MAKYDDLVARTEKLERQFSLLNSITQFRAGRDTKDLRELERIVDGLKRQLNGVSKQANKTEERLKDLTRNVARIDGSNDMRREDIGVLREEQDGLRAEQRAQAHTQLDFGKRLAALEQVWWNDPIGNETHRRIEQLVESAALDNERRLREELRGALDKRIAGLRSEWQYFKNLVGNDLYSLKEVQVKHGNRLDNCVAQDEDFHTRLEAVLKRIEALEKAPTKVIIPDYADELGALRDRVRNLEVADAVDLQLERIRKQETHTKSPSWREMVDNQKNVPTLDDPNELMSALLYHLRRIYDKNESAITGLVRIIALVEKNKHLTARDHRYAYVDPKVLARAIVENEWQRTIDTAATMLAEELAK